MNYEPKPQFDMFRPNICSNRAYIIDNKAYLLFNDNGVSVDFDPLDIMKYVGEEVKLSIELSAAISIDEQGNEERMVDKKLWENHRVAAEHFLSDVLPMEIASFIRDLGLERDANWEYAVDVTIELA